MAIKTTYLISCLILLTNCNVHAICNIGCDESQLGNTGYFASGSAHSSQYVLPSGEVVTHAKGSSYSSDGIKNTFEQLKHEANQFVSKQKDALNVPNALPPLHSGFNQDLQSLSSNIGDISSYPSQSYFNKVESASHQKKILSGGSQESQTYYQPLPLPQTSRISSTKKEQFNKKVITQGSPSYGASGVEEIEGNQFELDSNVNGAGILYQPLWSHPVLYPDNVKIQSGNTQNQHEVDSNAYSAGVPYQSINNVKVQSGNTQEEVETIETNAHVRPIVVQKIQAPSQTSFSKYEQSVKQNSSSHIVPGIPAYIPNGQFTTGIINLNTNDNQNIQSHNLNTFVSNKVPAKLSVTPEKHYLQNEEKESYYENVASVSSEVNSQQKEHKYNAVPVVTKGIDIPIKIKYIYDGKTLKKNEEYASGIVKNVPIAVEEYENTLKEIRQQSSSKASQSQSYVAQPVVHEKPELEGYYYYPKGQSLTIPSNAQTFKKEQSQASHSQQTIGNSNVEQFSHLPLNIHSQKQYYTQPGYTEEIILPAPPTVHLPPPAITISQINHADENAQAASELYKDTLSAILVRGVPQVPVHDQHSSSSSGSTFHSTSYSGSNGGFVFPSDSIASSHKSSGAYENLSSLNSGSQLLNCGDCLTGLSASGAPVKNSYGISTSFSSSSSNINGKKNENRHASVSVNDNGKVDTYNVKS